MRLRQQPSCMESKLAHCERVSIVGAFMGCRLAYALALAACSLLIPLPHCHPGSACTLCPAGTHSNSTGAHNISTCTGCAVGKASAAAGANSRTVCKTCAAGTYSGGDSWELIVSQNDAENNLFSSSTRMSYIQNQNSLSANPFMKVGLLDWDDCRGSDGKLELRVEWSGGTASQQVFTWKQASILTSGTIMGYEPGTGAPAASGSCTGFNGLGGSDDNRCVMDGNGAGNCWWNCVGAVGCSSPDCIPAADSKTATNVKLWIRRSDKPGAIGTYVVCTAPALPC